MDGWLDGGMDGWLDGWMEGWMDGWMEGGREGEPAEFVFLHAAIRIVRGNDLCILA